MKLSFLFRRQQTLFRLASVSDSKTFVGLVKSRTAVLKKMLVQQSLKESPHLRSRAFEQSALEAADASCEGLTSLSVREVEEIVHNKYELSAERLATCIVPYQVAANIILSRLPTQIRAEAVAELKEEEEFRLGNPPGVDKGKHRAHKWIQWFEKDLYVSDGLKYLRRSGAAERRRLPIFSVVGHAGHGKTVLMDALQCTDLKESETRFGTQSVRSFTIGPQDGLTPHYLYTFLETPGHQMFVESRFHAMLISDCVLLVISVVDGIESQTHEAIKVALNLDKPIIVVLTKLDHFSDSLSMKRHVSRISEKLSAIGLFMTIVHSSQDLKKVVLSQGADNNLFLPMKKTDPGYRGSKASPVLNLSRHCLGLCVSAARGVNLNLLWECLATYHTHFPFTCLSDTAKSTDHNCVVQAVVIESSKHLFDEEGFRNNARRQALQKSVDRKKEAEQKRFERNSLLVRLRSYDGTTTRKATSWNRTSSSVLCVSTVVREGVVRKGMHFIADQAEGCVDVMMDYWGNTIEEATPGMAVTLVDFHSISGCPATGTHVLSTINDEVRFETNYYRKLLQWYTESFYTQLHYLRPRGMDVSFKHLGDYGQVRAFESLEYQLLYGAPPSTEGTPQLQGTATSVGQYIAMKNAENTHAIKDPAMLFLEGLDHTNAISLHHHQHHQQSLEGEACTQSVMEPSDQMALEAAWSKLQPEKRPTSEKEYLDFMKNCLQVGVLLKVDSWHTGRMLLRETPRCGTGKVAFTVMGTRFGPLCEEDIYFFRGTAKVIICFRTPLASSAELDYLIESSDVFVLQTDNISDIPVFLKWCAVDIHRRENPKEELAPKKERQYMVLKRGSVVRTPNRLLQYSCSTPAPSSFS